MRFRCGYVLVLNYPFIFSLSCVFPKYWSIFCQIFINGFIITESAKSNKYAYVSYNVWDNVQCAYAMRFHGNIFITLSISTKKTDVLFNKRDDNVRRPLGH